MSRANEIQKLGKADGVGACIPRHSVTLIAVSVHWHTVAPTYAAGGRKR